jgi:hypothetical protein
MDEDRLELAPITRRWKTTADVSRMLAPLRGGLQKAEHFSDIAGGAQQSACSADNRCRRWLVCDPRGRYEAELVRTEFEAFPSLVEKAPVYDHPPERGFPFR